jgi:hypothetical protein
VALALGLALACTERGHVVVLVEEPGAELWVDGAPGGAIGAEGFELEAGPHRVEVKAEGYEPWSAEVEVRAARPAVLEVDLVGLAGALIVRSNVSGDTVWIDDKPVGPSGPHVHELPSGPHVVRVERPGYTPFVQEVEIEPEQTLTVEATLVGVGGRPPAAVHLEVVPVPVPAPVYAPRPPYYGPRPPRPPMPRPPRFP